MEFYTCVFECVHVHDVYVHMHDLMFMQVPAEVNRKHQIFQRCGFRQLLGTQLEYQKSNSGPMEKQQARFTSVQLHQSLNRILYFCRKDRNVEDSFGFIACFEENFRYTIIIRLNYFCCVCKLPNWDILYLKGTREETINLSHEKISSTILFSSSVVKWRDTNIGEWIQIHWLN